ncbi:MAG: hypothetical protein HY515_03975, partial [Candidatus Aenigmarchaeota archaeon]|nr:hypothetical protein [Candidatus Aenigmarchaeota archaeon]
ISVVFDHWVISSYDQNSHRKDYNLDAYDRITKITEYNIDPILNDGTIYTHNTTYGYDEADQLRRIIDAHGNNFTFGYDTLGRRTRLNDPDIGEWNYSYDLAGNLVSQAGGGGNLVTGDSFYREYNTLNQLIRIRNGSNSSGAVVEEYTYDPYGQRLKIWRNDSANTVVYTPFRELMQIRNNTGIYNFSYIYDGSTLVARVNPDGSKHYYHPDHLGSTSLITSSTGNIIENTYYEPYGDVDGGGTSDVKLYLGEFSDASTGQYLFGDRYFNPDSGRFIQPDAYISYYEPQGLNRYSYALNNPYKYKDDSGESPTLVLGAIGAVVGGGINLGVQLWQNSGDFSKVDYGSVAVSAGAGFIAGATLGLGTAVLGTSFAATVSSGAVAGVAGGQSEIFGENVLEGGDLTEGLFQTEDLLAQAGGGALGGALGSVGEKILGGKAPSYKAFTRSNFRENLATRTGVNPSGADAHHTIPVKFADPAAKAGINIHNPQYGVWVERSAHQANSKSYNDLWSAFFKTKKTEKEIAAFSKKIVNEIKKTKR